MTSSLPPLLKQDRDRIATMALAAGHELIRYSHVRSSNECVEWTPLRRHGDVDLYQGATSPQKRVPTIGLFCGVTHVYASLDEVIALNNNHAPIDKSNHFSLVVVPLYTIAPELPPTPSPVEGLSIERLVVQYVRFNSILKHVIRRRDSFVLECDIAFDAGGGKRGWLRVNKSLELPQLHNFDGCMCSNVRMDLRPSGHVYTECGSSFPRMPGTTLRVTTMHHCDFGGHVPEWVVASALKQRCRDHVGRLDRYLREARLSHGPWVQVEHCVPMHSKRACFRCHKKFGLVTNTRAHCRKCGQVVCSNCIRTWTVQVHGATQAMPACSVCSVRSQSAVCTTSPACTMEYTDSYANRSISSYSRTDTFCSNKVGTPMESCLCFDICTPS
ncbi:hypothetical protein H310_12400 [Aphanomyces invadans]|uniref:FYVE-type domain-containing protein n=1 Tax=Aphanomyces invadans TaxID=157072 RepID=A0A024TJ19_9STRA|nr:hypothetical protein H310_12400 [Aphanomyces invadans]ETV93606.1 hypothetical protein H310_12400 [Aphanomyces invadans]|eukprot:XP_008877647.1 hypothetical protein H310_12400 [Aphanomyces invadans]